MGRGMACFWPRCAIFRGGDGNFLLPWRVRCGTIPFRSLPPGIGRQIPRGRQRERRPAFFRPAPELVIRHCGVTGRLFLHPAGRHAALCPGVLAGVGTWDGSMSGEESRPTGRGGVPLCPQHAAHNCGRYFFARLRQKTGNPGMKRKILLYNRECLCYSN